RSHPAAHRHLPHQHLGDRERGRDPGADLHGVGEGRPEARPLRGAEMLATLTASAPGPASPWTTGPPPRTRAGHQLAPGVAVLDLVRRPGRDRPPVDPFAPRWHAL